MRPRAGRRTTLIASGFDGAEQILLERVGNAEISQPALELDGFVSQVDAPASWAVDGAHFIETNLDLVVAFRSDNLVAIHCDSGLSDGIQRWLDKSPRPPFRRIPPGVLNAALLTGEAKGLWLRGTHARRTTKADTKNISGRRLQDALSPLEDSSFAMGSARSELPVGEVFGEIARTVGTTPRRSLVWVSRTGDFREFVNIIGDLLSLLANTMATGASVDSPYPWLATELRNLNGVSGAYEIMTLSPDEVPRTPDWPEEAVAAAVLLENVTFDVVGQNSGPSFTSDVAVDGSLRGRVRCSVQETNGTVQLSFGHEGAATDTAAVEIVVDALQFTDLITVYYDSGHAISSGSVWSASIRPFPFPNWDWRNFSGYNIQAEKPDGDNPQEIHDRIAENGDNSLFAWVVQRLAPTGWLTCDDGAGEIADFVGYEGDGGITLIHVKRANSTNPRRRVNVTAYEQVTSQATKNLAYLNVRQLIERLETPLVSRPACWCDGARTDDRSELLEYLRIRPASAPMRIVVVQPQMTKWRYDHTMSPEGLAADIMRLGLLETLLNGARGAVTGLGADMFVAADSAHSL